MTSGQVAGCILPNGEVADIAWAGGSFTSVSPSGRAGAGLLALPRLVDSHVHLDKTLYGAFLPPHRNVASLEERIGLEEELLEDPAIEPVALRAGRLLAALVAHGAGALRSHVDVSARVGLGRLVPLLELRASRCPIPLQLVAFPQRGVSRSPGTAELLDEALSGGCEVVGGLDPAGFDEDRAGQLDCVVSLARAHRARLDIHLHERGEEGAATLEMLAGLVSDAGLEHRAAVSHGFCLADLWVGDRRRFDAITEQLAAAGISLVTSLPGEGLCPPVGGLLARGVEVVVASDNIRDSWSPFGRADPLERAAQVAHLEGWRSPSELLGALDLVTRAASRLLGLTDGGIAVGQPADLCLVRAASLAEALAAQPAERCVIVGGRAVAGAGLLEQASAGAA